ncbi:MAG: aminopeptidase P family protein [Chloroflexi bacterium]|nr:aminopeptidase P family protein [Chloroflexota bacterium]
MRLTPAFYRRTIVELQRRLHEAHLDGLLIFKPHNIHYLLGFFFFPTERTVGAWLPAEGEPALFIPKLEEDHAATYDWLTRVEVYFEHLGPPHPVEWIAQKLKGWGHAKGRIGYETSLGDGTLTRLKKNLPGAHWSPEGGRIVADMRLVKDAEELRLLRKAGEYADFMVACGAATVRERGLISELEINQIVNQAVVNKMMAELSEVIFVGGVSGGIVCAGPRAAFPHGLPSLAKPQIGDPLILSFGCSVGGYHAESERTFFIGEPAADHQKYYEVMRAAQAAGVEAIAPGRSCAETNRVCLDVLRRAGFGEFIKHRMGHGLGLEGHEPPWIEDGDSTVFRPGMVVSAEPGLYVPRVGGYRISDTVIVGEAGPEAITRFPRDLEAMILSV